jgi:hypothetical protein
MIVCGHAVSKNYAALWELAETCQSFLGQAEELMALTEDATGSRLEPWRALSRQEWTQGRLFGRRGELRWRAYGPLVRTAIVTDTTPAGGRPLQTRAEVETNDDTATDESSAQARLKELGFEDVQTIDLKATDPDGEQFLWRGVYKIATTRRYVDAEGNIQCVRYCGVA